MLYESLRSAAAVALDWYYAGILVQGRERVPRRGPVLIVANHPNALVDALVVATTLGRRVQLTAKATLFEHRPLALLLRRVGVVPLRRASDERAALRAGAPAPDRNTSAFRLVSDALRAGGAVLVFPEGISHDDPSLAPLRTGAARMAFEARQAGAAALQLLPVGLVFEEKERPRSRLLVRVGRPIDVDAWCAAHDVAQPAAAADLTRAIDEELRQVTLNFATPERAARAISLARALAAITDPPPALGRAPSLAAESDIARRIEAATEALAAAPPSLAARADALTTRIDALAAQATSRGMQLSEITISPRLRHGAWFAVREGTLAVLALPLALVGRVTHWLPLRLARSLAMRSLAGDPSRDQPAMRTIVLGVALVGLWYLLQGWLAARLAGWAAAVLWLALIFGAARIDFVLRDRLARAGDRARTWLALRRDPGFRDRLLEELRALLAEAVALEDALSAVEAGAGDRPDPSATLRDVRRSVGP